MLFVDSFYIKTACYLIILNVCLLIVKAFLLNLDVKMNYFVGLKLTFVEIGTTFETDIINKAILITSLLISKNDKKPAHNSSKSSGEKKAKEASEISILISKVRFSPDKVFYLF